MAQEQVKARSRRRAAGVVLCGALFALGWAAPNTTRAQPDDDTPRVLVGRDDKKAADLKFVAVRPNVSQPIRLYVQNTAGKERPLTVRLLALQPKPAEPVLIATADLGKVPPGPPVPVPQWKPAVPPAPPVAGQPAVPAGVDLAGPDFGVRVEVLAADNAKPLQTRDLTVRLLNPLTYVHVVDAEYTSSGAGKANNRLRLRLQADAEFAGPPCPVSLDLRPAVIPGLGPERTQGTFEDVLTEPEQTVTLLAENLKFRGTPSDKGLVYVTVDGYERAFIYRTDFTRARATPDVVEAAALRIVPRDHYTLPAAEWPVRLEVDNPPAPDMQLRLGIDRNRDGEVKGQEVKGLPAPGDRRRTVRLLLPPADGTLVLKTEVQPWTVALNSRGLLGTSKVQAWAGYKKQGQTEELTDSTTVTFAGAKPSDVKFVSAAIPRRLEIGKSLPVRATAESAGAPITEAVFFLGRPAPDGKLPADAITAAAALKKDEAGLWLASAELPIPADSKSPTPISVRFTNAVGLSADETIKIEWVPPAPPAAVKPSIEGVIYVGDLPQPKLTVLLLDAAGATRDSTTTDAAGKYVFKDVVPGSYRVSAAKPGGSKGETPVQVREGDKRTGVDVKLTR